MKNLLITVLFIFCLPVMAGSKSHSNAIYSPEQIATFAKQVERYAAQQGARAFIIGRIGRKPKDLPKGIKYTHTAVAIYSSISLKNGKSAKGYVIHNLYQRDGQENKSDLVTDYPVDFFWGAQRLTAGISIPTPALQQKLIEVFSRGGAKKLHNENYSVIANPLNNKYQNCTEHTLLLLNAAIYNTTDTTRLYANNKAYFTPQKVHTSVFKLMFGSAFIKGVSTADHQGKIKTATFTSIARYLNKYQLLEKSISLDSEGRINNNL
ncbi:MAG: DUF2145 domain-containing protein [Pseudomonadales bacterium]|nr:DUF2145 domain-containing protein [Pseudomonadales bacterium]NRA17759.1 DUF2145 domain-containing protein [Oceanospirillaceae bacterium]